MGHRAVHRICMPRGLTLVEVLAVLVLLGLLAGTLFVGFSGVVGEGKRELAKTGISILVGKLEAYHVEVGEWPAPDTGLNALSDGQAAPTDPYYVPPDRLIDPWGTPYELVVPGPDGHPYEVLCLGGDGQLGGTGEAADISSTNLRADEPR